MSTRGVAPRRALRPGLHVRLAVAVLCVAATATRPASVAGQLAIHTEVDTTLVHVGDRIVLTVSVDHPADAAVIWPDSLDLSPFEVLGARQLPQERLGAGARSGVRFDLTAFELGELEIPAFEVAVVTADGGRTELETDRFGVEVVSVGADETGDIRDIRGPLAIPISVLRVAGWLLAFLLVAAAALLAYRRWRGSRAGAPRAQPPLLARPPHEVALEALAKLESAGLLERGEVKAYHIEVSEILRRYVEGRYAVPALEMTTWEVLDGLGRVGVGEDFREGLRRFLDQCDLVKFAKVRPDGATSRDVLELGRRLVTESAPRVEASRTEGEAASSDSTVALEV